MIKKHLESTRRKAWKSSVTLKAHSVCFLVASVLYLQLDASYAQESTVRFIHPAMPNYFSNDNCTISQDLFDNGFRSLGECFSDQKAAVAASYEDIGGMLLTLSPSGTTRYGCLGTGNHTQIFYFQEGRALLSTGSEIDVSGHCLGQIQTPTQYDPFHPPETCKFVGNPIDLTLGAKEQVESDFSGEGVFPIEVSRFYKRLPGELSTVSFSSIGSNWRASFDRKIEISTNIILLQDAQNNLIRFINSGSGQWFPDHDDIPSVIEEDASGIWIHKKKDRTKDAYSSTGLLIYSENSVGLKHTYTYEGEKLVQISDDFGRYLDLEYGTEGLLTAISDASGSLAQYEYDANRNLIKVTYPDATAGDPSDNPTRQYLYEDARFPHALTGIIDENSERYATWAYDDQGRAISSEHAGGADRTMLAYNADGTTTVTNALGKQTTYHFDSIQGEQKVTLVEGHPTPSCAGANKAYTYDANGFLASKSDWNGNVTTYVHDTRGLETSRTEAAGTPESRTITTEWHTDYRLPIRITKPDTITEFEYDTTGRLLSKRDRSIQ